MPPFTADYFCHSDHDSYSSENDDIDPFDYYEDVEYRDEENVDDDDLSEDIDDHLLPFPKELEPLSELLYDRITFSYRKPDNCFVFVQGVKLFVESDFKVVVYCVMNDHLKEIKHFLLCFVDYPDLFLDIFGFRSRNELLVSFRGSRLIPWDDSYPHNFSTNTKEINDLSEILKSNKNF
jgi:hypothetical protein